MSKKTQAAIDKREKAKAKKPKAGTYEADLLKPDHVPGEYSVKKVSGSKPA